MCSKTRVRRPERDERCVVDKEKLGAHVFFFLMILLPPRSTQGRSSAASDVYKRQPMGVDLKYVDKMTISKSLECRRNM